MTDFNDYQPYKSIKNLTFAEIEYTDILRATKALILSCTYRRKV